MVSMMIPFELLHDFPFHRVCGKGGREVTTQILHGTGVDEIISEDNGGLLS